MVQRVKVFALQPDDRSSPIPGQKERTELLRLSSDLHKPILRCNGMITKLHFIQLN